MAAALVRARADLAGLRPHDLRRMCATRLNTLGVLPHITEKILNHTMQGVMAVYNRADYEAERIEAMQRWADELDRVLGAIPREKASGEMPERRSAPGSVPGCAPGPLDQ